MMTLLFSTDGRINRAQYWLGALLSVIIIAAFGLLGTLLWQIDPMQPDPDKPGSYHLYGMPAVPYLVLGLAYAIVMIWATVSLGAKRCHDRGRPGVFMLLMFVPLLNFWYLIEVAFLRGTVGPNQYGPDPLSPEGRPTRPV